jgi:hypothetical protein
LPEAQLARKGALGTMGGEGFALRKEKGETESMFDISKLCYVFGK